MSQLTHLPNLLNWTSEMVSKKTDGRVFAALTGRQAGSSGGARDGPGLSRVFVGG